MHMDRPVRKIAQTNPRPSSGLLSDNQYDDIFNSVLDSSLEHCLEDARAVLSEVELLQASLDQDCDRGEEQDSSLPSSRSRKKKKLKESRAAATREQPSTKHQWECQEETQHSYSSQETYDPWVQCSVHSCRKWRRLELDADLSVLPSDWTCSLNTDRQRSSCEVPQESWSGSEGELIYSSLVPGSMVWAQQPGFTWWPAMIEADPDSKTSFLFNSRKDESPSKYHVTYFGNPVCRAWVSSSRVRAFHALSQETAVSAVNRQTSRKMLNEALHMAREAQELSLKRRLSQFGFCCRYAHKTASSPGSGHTAERMWYLEYSSEEEDAAVTLEKRKRIKAAGANKAATVGTKQRQRGKNGRKMDRNTELGSEGEKVEEKKAAHPLFTGSKKKKATSKPAPPGTHQTVPEFPACPGQILTSRQKLLKDTGPKEEEEDFSLLLFMEE
ncbi:hypothetical protein MATL_G00166290 [Megalops atlanticus]|uniref:Zinc finger CW-type PWWP domain protein 1 n=1 Tax=Megalops atlanticus TaxID=7932 RepID=A0A9D3PSY8_MEGAT|nr:hypothetical protein MATL_G00166290 [Megalops atlanticus]